jgi:hypothetical protein
MRYEFDNHVLHLAGMNIVTTYLNCLLFQHGTNVTTMFHSYIEIEPSQLKDAPAVMQQASPCSCRRQRKDLAVDSGNVVAAKQPRKKNVPYTPGN